MTLIKKATELQVAKTVKMMIYGQAGMGKTTLALSMPKPLLLDFDNGVKRVSIGQLDGVDVVPVTNWQDIQSLLTMDLSAYDTIVVDTIGKMMDFIIAYRCGSRNPRIQDWSAINNDFKQFIQSVNMLKKNVVFVAHRDVQTDGDNRVFVPALRTKNYNAIVTELDLLGYVRMCNENGMQKRTITFDPTEYSDGKNTCNMPGVMIIPTINDQNGNVIAKNDFLTAQVLGRYGKMIEQKEHAAKEYADILNEISTGVEQITDAQSANYFLSHIGEYKQHGSSVIIKTRDMFAKKVNSLKLVYNKSTKQYSDPKGA